MDNDFDFSEDDFKDVNRPEENKAPEESSNPFEDFAAQNTEAEPSQPESKPDTGDTGYYNPAAGYGSYEQPQTPPQQNTYQQPQSSYQQTPPQTPPQPKAPTQSSYQQAPQQQASQPQGAPANQSSYQPYNFRQPYQQNNQQPAQQAYNPTPVPPTKKNGKKTLIIIVIVAVVLAIILGLVIKLTSGSNSSTTTTTEASTVTVTDEQGSAVTDENGEAATETSSSPVQYTESSSEDTLTATEIADKCRASVVGVMTYENGELSGEGSGVVMGTDSTGTYTYIMTCAHVISDSGVTYGVLTLDGVSYNGDDEVTLVAYDTRTDIGVLKVKGTNFTVAEFGDSTAMKIGDKVYAIGNPGGSEYFGSMTEGIVSAIDRTVSSTYNITCIQHDAAINPGNSGGALVNDMGQVIGINSSKIASTDYEGMGFAVPTSTALTVAESLINYGYVPNRPKLGITYASVSQYQVYSMVVAIKNLPSGSLIITDISDDSSFVGTKAEVGDMIIAVNGTKMDKSDVLLDLIDKGAVGDTLTLTLCRVDSSSYKTTEFDVTIKLVEDKGSSTTEEATEDSLTPSNGNGSGSYYSNGDYSDFSDFFKNYFGF